MWYTPSTIMAACLTCGIASVAAAATSSSERPAPTERGAQSIAVQAVGGGIVAWKKVGEEAGQRVYEFAIDVANKDNVELVTVRASDGRVIGMTYDGEDNGAGASVTSSRG